MTPEFKKRVQAVLQSSTDDFAELLKLAGLDPSTDLAQGDWAGVDFGTTDVSTFNFTGADVSGANFSKVRGLKEHNFRDAIGVKHAMWPSSSNLGSSHFTTTWDGMEIHSLPNADVSPCEMTPYNSKLNIKQPIFFDPITGFGQSEDAAVVRNLASEDVFQLGGPVADWFELNAGRYRHDPQYLIDRASIPSQIHTPTRPPGEPSFKYADVFPNGMRHDTSYTLAEAAQLLDSLVNVGFARRACIIKVNIYQLNVIMRDRKRIVKQQSGEMQRALSPWINKPNRAFSYSLLVKILSAPGLPRGIYNFIRIRPDLPRVSRIALDRQIVDQFKL